MKKHEKLRKEAEALKLYADTLAANNELHKELVKRTEIVTEMLLDNKVSQDAIETYRASIHNINIDAQAITRNDQYASARLRAELKEIEAEFFQGEE